MSVTNNTLVQQTTGSKVKHLFTLLKFRLSSLVVFSGGFGYMLAPHSGSTDWPRFLVFCLSSFMITGSANIINQIIEKDLDKLMKRTANRPLPTGAVEVSEAIILSFLLATIGTTLLVVFVNELSAALALLSLVLYAFVYTPLKQKSPICVFVGAIPGALPPLIGWAAMAGEISLGALVIFSIQFIWQFPHFWAIAWVADEDYRNAGFKMLPASGKDLGTAFQIMIYTLFLIPMGLLPAQFGITGFVSAIVATCCGVGFMIPALYLMKTGTNKAALRLMFGSFIYLPVTQIAYWIDKL